jgi:hypothetical protein
MKTILIISVITFNVFVFLFMKGANKKSKPPKNEAS